MQRVLEKIGKIDIEQRLKLREKVKNKIIVALDVNAWIYAANDSEFFLPLKNVLEDGLSKGSLICPPSFATLYELQKKSNQDERQIVLKYIDRLSNGVCFAHVFNEILVREFLPQFVSLLNPRKSYTLRFPEYAFASPFFLYCNSVGRVSTAKYNQPISVLWLRLPSRVQEIIRTTEVQEKAQSLSAKDRKKINNSEFETFTGLFDKQREEAVNHAIELVNGEYSKEKAEVLRRLLMLPRAGVGNLTVELSTWIRTVGTPITGNDIFDAMFIENTLPFANYLLCDKKMAATVRSSRVVERFGYKTKVFDTSEDSILRMSHELKQHIKMRS